MRAKRGNSRSFGQFKVLSEHVFVLPSSQNASAMSANHIPNNGTFLVDCHTICTPEGDYRNSDSGKAEFDRHNNNNPQWAANS